LITIIKIGDIIFIIIIQVYIIIII